MHERLRFERWRTRLGRDGNVFPLVTHPTMHQFAPKPQHEGERRGFDFPHPLATGGDGLDLVARRGAPVAWPVVVDGEEEKGRSSRPRRRFLQAGRRRNATRRQPSMQRRPRGGGPRRPYDRDGGSRSGDDGSGPSNSRFVVATECEGANRETGAARAGGKSGVGDDEERPGRPSRTTAAMANSWTTNPIPCHGGRTRS